MHDIHHVELRHCFSAAIAWLLDLLPLSTGSIKEPLFFLYFSIKEISSLYQHLCFRAGEGSWFDPCCHYILVGKKHW